MTKQLLSPADTRDRIVRTLDLQGVPLHSDNLDFKRGSVPVYALTTRTGDKYNVHVDDESRVTVHRLRAPYAEHRSYLKPKLDTFALSVSIRLRRAGLNAHPA